MSHVVAGRYLIARKRYDLALQTVRLLASRAARGDAQAAEQALKIGVDLLDAMGFRPRRTPDGIYVSSRPEWTVGVSDTLTRGVLDFGQSIAAALTQVMNSGDRETISDHLSNAEDFLDEFNRMNRDAGDRFRHGPFNVVLLSDALSGELKATLDLLDAVSDRIRRHAPQVLYGNVFVTDKPIVNEGRSAVGIYRRNDDTIALSLGVAKNRDDVYVLAHEFGHRFEARFLSGADREAFQTLSIRGDLQPRAFTRAEREHAVDEYITMWDAIRADRDDYGPPDDLASDWYSAFSTTDRPLFKQYVIPLIRKYRDEKDDSALPELRKELGRLDVSGPISYPTNTNPEPIHASMYGATDWHENFAETFAHYIMGKALPEPLEQFIRRVLG